MQYIFSKMSFIIIDFHSFLHLSRLSTISFLYCIKQCNVKQLMDTGRMSIFTSVVDGFEDIAVPTPSEDELAPRRLCCCWPPGDEASMVLPTPGMARSSPAPSLATLPDGDRFLSSGDRAAEACGVDTPDASPLPPAATTVRTAVDAADPESESTLSAEPLTWCLLGLCQKKKNSRNNKEANFKKNNNYKKKKTPVKHDCCVHTTLVPSARLTLNSTKLCTKFKIFRKKIFFGTKVNSEAFLSSSQNLKVTRLQGCTKTKL
jgi:hypothetical protein